MRLRCNLCLKYLCNGASKKTEELWLREIRGRDYLVCEYHRKGGAREKREPFGGGDLPAVQKEIR